MFMNEVLLKLATLGTDRSPNITESIKDTGELLEIPAQFIANCNASAPWKMLLIGGVHATAQAVGMIPETINIENSTGSGNQIDSGNQKAAEVTGRKRLHPKLSLILLKIIREFQETPAVSVYYMKLMSAKGVMISPRYFPEFFDLISKRTIYQQRDLLDALLGPCGLWLAGLNPAWQWYVKLASESSLKRIVNNGVTEEAEDDINKDRNGGANNGAKEEGRGASSCGQSKSDDIWLEGTFTQRLMFLREKRHESPDEARELLVAIWKGEKAEGREAFLSVLEDNLSSSDIPLLDKAVRDRASGVRAVAIKLCGRLSDSQFYRNAIERAASLIIAEPELQIQLPTEYTKEMKAAGILEKAPRGVGERAWWFLQSIEQVPLSFWEEKFKRSPEDILALCSKDDNYNLILIAWMRSWLHFAELKNWLMPLWDQWILCKKRNSTLSLNNDSMELELMERCLTLFPEEFWRKYHEHPILKNCRSLLTQIFSRLAETLPLPWSDSFVTVFYEYLVSLRSNESGLAYAAMLPYNLMYRFHDQLEKKSLSMIALNNAPPILQKIVYCQEFYRILEEQNRE